MLYWLTMTANASKQDIALAMPRTLHGWRELVLRAMLRGLLLFGALALLGGINIVLTENEHRHA